MARAYRSALVLTALLALPSTASAYDQQISLDLDLGWGLAPAIAMLPDHGPTASVGGTLGFDDTWALGLYAGWAVHPPFVTDTDPVFQLGMIGVEGLYYIDIFQIVPFFGLGVDLLPSTDGTEWAVDFAAHVRVSVDYLVSREVAIGVDIRPYILFTALPDINPVYLTFQARISLLFDYI